MMAIYHWISSQQPFDATVHTQVILVTGKTHQQQIRWSTRLGADGPEILPIRSKRWDSILGGSMSVKLAEINDIILHGRCETRTLQSSLPNTLQKHRGQAQIIIVAIDTLNEKGQQVNGRLMQHVSLLNGDEIYHIPRILWIVSNKSFWRVIYQAAYLDKGTDEALEWALWTVLREWRL
jgi:hypothetical protein